MSDFQIEESFRTSRGIILTGKPDRLIKLGEIFIADDGNSYMAKQIIFPKVTAEKQDILSILVEQQ